MNLSAIHNIHLSFNESNILSVNIRDFNKAHFISRLDVLLRNTKDPRLLSELESLLKKIQDLSPEEFDMLRTDIQQKKVVFNPEYVLPSIE